jgi:long-subunit fatty acid transport protein
MRFICRQCFIIGLLTLFYTDTGFPDTSWATWQKKSGPISIINQSPSQLLFLQPVQDRADTLPKGHGSIKLNTTVTSTLVSQQTNQYSATFDLETIRTSLDMAYGILPRLELGLSIPCVYYYGGFMDKPILEVERLFGDPRHIREEEKADQYNAFVKKNGKTILSGSKNSSGIGDTVLRIKGNLWSEGDILPALSARVAAKLPTGNEDRFFGSGEFDWGLGILLQKDIDKMSAYANADITFPGNAFDNAGVSLREFYTVMIGTEYRLTSRLSGSAQISWITRPFQDTGLDMLNRRIFDLLVGLTYRFQNGMFLQTGGVEDIISSTEAGSDFTFFLNAGLHF